MRVPTLVVLALIVTSCGGGGPAATSAPATTAAAAPTATPSPVAAATAARTQTPQPTPSGPRLTYVKGSTKKVEQIIGDVDVETGAATAGRSNARFGLVGTDLGQSFEHGGAVWFLFGDAMGTGGDPIGFSRSTDPAGPLVIDYVTDARGRYLHVAPDGKPILPFEVPVAGISLGGTMFITIKGNHSDTDPMSDISTVVRYDEASKKFTTVRELSRLPQGHFIKNSLRLAPDGLQGLPPGGPHVLMFGTGEYRNSDAYLAVVPVASFGAAGGTAATRYYAGPGPKWSEKETEAVPLFAQKMGDISVVHAPQIGLWIMTYDGTDPKGVRLRTAQQPWGPWSEPQTLFSFDEARTSGFVYDPRDPRIKPEPVAQQGFDPKKDSGAIYGPYQIERFMRLSGDTLTIEWVLSTWVPYVVVRMRSQLRIERP
jgi:hypothetical protein